MIFIPKNIFSRKRVLLSFYFLLSFVILYRYFILQIVENEKYEAKAGNNSLRKIILNAPRGIIYDRNYVPLVDNKPLYEIKVIPQDFNKNNFNFKLLESHTGIARKKINQVIDSSRKVMGGRFKPMLLKRHIDFNTKAILEESKLDLKGLYFSELPARIYTSSCNMSHVLGYLRQIDQKNLDNSNYHSNDIIGFSGVERKYEKQLRGSYGVDYLLVDRLGVVQGKHETENKFDPIQGDDLVLSIDSRIQSLIEESTEKFKGAAIVMNPDNGEIIALASFPDYDLNSFVGPIPIKDWKKLASDKNKPFTNRATQLTYPPGSIFKLTLAAIALEKNLVTKSTFFKCDGKYQFYDTVFKCWNEDGHGNINLNDAIKKSCNIYFYNLMQRIDFDLWSEETLKFGFGEVPLLDLPGGISGIIPNRSYMTKIYKNKGGWSEGHMLNLSIGQGEISVTPLQIINLINLIATNGKTYSSHININMLESETEKINLDYNNSVWNFLKQAMYSAVNGEGGTAYNAKIDNDSVSIYGKTGTSQVCSSCDLEPHGWFAGFMELENGKRYSICILIENGGKGSGKSTLLAKKIFNYILDLNNV